MSKHSLLLGAVLVSCVLASPCIAKCPKSGCPQLQAPIYQQRQQMPQQMQLQRQQQFQQQQPRQQQLRAFQQPGSGSNQRPFQQRNSQQPLGRQNPFGAQPAGKVGAGQNPFAQGNTSAGYRQANPFSSQNRQGNPFATGNGAVGHGNSFGANARSQNARGNPFSAASPASAQPREARPGHDIGQTGLSTSKNGGARELGRQGISPKGDSRTFAIDKSTNVISHHRGQAITISHNNADGSRVVIHSRKLADGSRRTDAYKLTSDRAAHTQTRQYLDGRRVTIGKDFVRRSAPGHLTITTHSNGLRDATLRNGKPIFREAYGSKQDIIGHQEKTIVRTVYARVYGGKAYTLSAPVVETYGVVEYGDVFFYPYYPWVVPVAFYDPFFLPFSFFMPIADFCPDCLPPDVEFDGPSTYDDPDAVLADMQIASGFDDGSNDSPEEVGPPNAQIDPNVAPIDLGNTQDPDTQDVRDDVKRLQGDVDQAAAENGDLHEAVSGPQQGHDKQAKGRVKVPAAVRKQMTKQVKEELGREKAQQPISLIDVAASADASKHLFTVNDMIEATLPDADDECVLSMGDIVRFDQIPAEGDATAEMRVITSKQGSCEAGTTVQVSLGDLQEMLNAFSKRLEVNMQKAHDRIVLAERKQRPT